MKKIGILLLVLGPSLALAQTAAVTGHCTLGGTPAAVSGLKSTNYLQGIIPSCTITVYQTGTTTLATIYSDKNNTPLSNPFTANAATSSDPGAWTFFVNVSTAVDVVGSGGILPNIYPAPVTLLTDAFPGQQSAGCGNPGSGVIPKGATTGSGCLSSALDDGVTTPGVVTSTKPVIAPAALSNLTPRFDVEAKMSSADGHGGQDVGYAVMQYVNALAGTGLCNLELSHSYLGKGSYKIWTPINLGATCSLHSVGGVAVFQPQDGGAGGVWSATDTRIQIPSATMTQGSPTITFSAGPIVTADMKIGPFMSGIPDADYVLSATSTSATLALTPSLTVSGNVTNGSNQLCAVPLFRGLAIGQAFLLPTAAPFGGSLIYTWQGGGTTATITAIDQTASGRCVTFSANILVSPIQNAQRPIALTAAAGTTWTAPLTAGMYVPVITMAYPYSQFWQNFQGFTMHGGISGISISDPSYGSATTSENPLTPGRTIYGVDGIQVIGRDAFTLNNISVSGITGSAFIIGGDDHGGTYCSTGVGGSRESTWSNLHSVDSGDWSTGSGIFEVMGPACGGDQPNQITINGLHIAAPWAPGIVVGSYASSAPTVGNPRQLYFEGSQVEGSGRTLGYTVVPAPLVEIQRADDVYFTESQIARPTFGYCAVCITGAVKSVQWVNSTMHMAGAAANVGSWTGTANNSSSQVTFTAGPNIYTHFPTDGTWDGQFIKMTNGGTSWYVYATSVNGVSNAGLTLNLTSNLGGPSACNSTCTVTFQEGYAGYPVWIAGSLSQWNDREIFTNGYDNDSLNALVPGHGVFQTQDVFMAGSCPDLWSSDMMGIRKASSCIYADNASDFGPSGPLVAGARFCPRLTTTGQCIYEVGVTDSNLNTLQLAYNPVAVSSSSNFGTLGIAASSNQYKFRGDGWLGDTFGNVFDDGFGNASFKTATATGFPTGCVQYPCVVYAAHLTGLTAAQGSTLLISGPTNGDYQERVTVQTTTPGTGSATTVTGTLAGGPCVSQTTATANLLSLASNATITCNFGEIGGDTFRYSTTISGTATGFQYQLYVELIRQQ